MDPSIMKKLLEDDEDENMHSGADVDAFQAALNRDIGGDLNPPPVASTSDAVVMCQGSSMTTPSQSLPQFETVPRDEHNNYQAQRDQEIPGPQETSSSGKESVNSTSIPENNNPQKNSSQQTQDLATPQIPSQDDRPNVEAEPIPQPTVPQLAGKIPVTMHEPDKIQNPDNESQYMKLQKMSNQQATAPEQASTATSRGRQVPFGLLLPVLMNQLDKDKGMQLQELFAKLRRDEMTKDVFIRLIRGVVGEQVLKLAVLTVQSQLQAQATTRKQPTGVPSVTAGATQFRDSRSHPQTQQKGTANSTNAPQIPALKHQGQSNPSHPIMKVDRQPDSHGMQKHVHFSQASFTPYGANVGNSHMYSGTNVTNPTLPIKPLTHPHPHPHPHPHDSQMRQMQNLGSGGEAHGPNMLGPKVERQNLSNDPSTRIHGGSLSHFSSNSGTQQRPVPWQPSVKRDQGTGQLPTSTFVKPEPVDQSSELHHKLPMSTSQGTPSVSAAQIEHGSMSRDELYERRPPTLSYQSSANIVPSQPTSMNPASSSVPMQVDPNIPSGPRVISGTPLPGNNIKTPPKKPSVGQKKPLEALGNSPPAASKKQKVSGGFLDQSIEQLNDVTAVSGVNLREEEEQLFSLPKEDSRASEASRKAVQEEEERLILQKNPLREKLVKIMSKFGLKCVSNDVERCLSLSVEERMRGLMDNLIRVSKQRVDVEKSRHQVITTSDIRHQIMMMNRKAKEDWEKKQAEAEKLRKQNEPETSNGDDGEKEKDEGRNKSGKNPANKEEDDKMRTTAANVAARAAAGGDDMLSKWQLMAEQARQKREGGSTDSPSASHSSIRNKSSTPARPTKDHHDNDKRGGGRKSGRNQGTTMPQIKVVRSIAVKDVIAVLERESQMSKSTILYRLHDKVRSETAPE